VKPPSFGLLLVAALAVGTGLNGFYTGVTDLLDARNTLTVLVGAINLIMGVAGLSAAVLIWRQDRRGTPLIVAWGATVVGVAVLRPRAYAPEMGWPTAIVGGVVTAALIVTVVLYARWRLGVTAAGESSPAS
jgi:hypothetical protein